MALRRSSAVAGAILLSALFATSAEAVIEPQLGIAKIELGMTAAEVIAEKGTPDVDKVVLNQLVGEQRKMRYGKTKVFFGGADDAAQVVTLYTRSRGQRTRDGAGVGSTEEKVKEAIPRIRCVDDGPHYCLLGRPRAGRKVTNFLFSNRTDRVSRVVVSFVLD